MDESSESAKKIRIFMQKSANFTEFQHDRKFNLSFIMSVEITKLFSISFIFSKIDFERVTLVIKNSEMYN